MLIRNTGHRGGYPSSGSLAPACHPLRLSHQATGEYPSHSASHSWLIPSAEYIYNNRFERLADGFHYAASPVQARR